MAWIKFTNCHTHTVDSHKIICHTSVKRHRWRWRRWWQQSKEIHILCVLFVMLDVFFLCSGSVRNNVFLIIRFHIISVARFGFGEGNRWLLERKVNEIMNGTRRQCQNDVLPMRCKKCKSTIKLKQMHTKPGLIQMIYDTSVPNASFVFVFNDAFVMK